MMATVAQKTPQGKLNRNKLVFKKPSQHEVTGGATMAVVPDSSAGMRPFKDIEGESNRRDALRINTSKKVPTKIEHHAKSMYYTNDKLIFDTSQISKNSKISK